MSDAVYQPPGRRHSRVLTVGFAVAALLFLYPFLWMFLGAFKENRELFRPMDLWPAVWDTAYFHQLFSGDYLPFFRVLGNSILVALGQALGAVAVCSLAGYVLSRHRFRGKSLVILAALLVIVLPRQAMAVPLFSWLHQLGLVDSLAGVILPGWASGLGLIYFTLIFRQVPDELVEAARLEGASEFRVYWILLPLVGNALCSFGLIQFILAWHEHLIPMLVLNSTERQTLPLALASLYGSSLRFPYAVLMAGSTLTLFPVGLLFLILARRLRSALADLCPS